MDWLHDWLWLVWLGLAIAAGAVEVLTLHFVFVMVAGGALAAAAAAFFTGSVPLSILVFALATAALLVGARPPLLKAMRASTPQTVTNAAALVGRSALVLTEVTTTAGTVKLGGEVWTARAEGGRGFEVGSTVTVVRIDGATAVVIAAPRLPRGKNGS